MRRVLLVFVMCAATLPSSPAKALPAFGESMGWITKCGFSHRNMDDPIVYPNQPGASHQHSFYGNRSVNAGSTYASMLAAGTTCGFKADKAGYWIPTMRLNGKIVEATKVSFYYRNVIYPPSSVRPFPKNLRIIVGDPHATTNPNVSHIWWECGDDAAHTVAPQQCGAENLVLHVKFPECWDGSHTDSGDHKSHMAWSTGLEGDWNQCPSGFPVALPRLIVRYEWEGVHDGSAVSFSCGDYRCVHADFWQTWRQYKLRQMVTKCINASVDCGVPTAVPA